MIFTSDSSETASSGTNARPEAALVTAAAVIRNWRRVGMHSAGNMGNSVSCGLRPELSEAILAQEDSSGANSYHAHHPSCLSFLSAIGKQQFRMAVRAERRGLDSLLRYSRGE